jgi:FMN phosphatase YigB (HAD superfamily)
VKSLELKIRKETILFFDLDGTLVETDYANFLAYSMAINMILNKNINYNPNERFTREKLLINFPNITKKQLDNIIEIKEKIYKDFLPKTILNKESYYILNKYSKTNKTVLVTNCRKRRALMILQYYNITKKFDKLFFFRQSNKDKKVNKFKEAISDLNVIPQNIIVIENDESEMLNAIDAGISKDNIILMK